MTSRDELGVIYEDRAFAPLFGSGPGRPAESPGCLALVTVLQFAENLTDRKAADSVRGWIDWKYLLGLELRDPGLACYVRNACQEMKVRRVCHLVNGTSRILFVRSHVALTFQGGARESNNIGWQEPEGEARASISVEMADLAAQ